MFLNSRDVQTCIQNTAVIIFGGDSERIANFLPIGFK